MIVMNRSCCSLIFSDAPMVSSLTPIVAAESFALNVKLQCEIDSYPQSNIVWTYNDRQISNSNKYSIVENQTSSSLIIQQLQSNVDYGLYTCNASNRLGKNSTTIQLRSKGMHESFSLSSITVVAHDLDVPETPTNFNLTSQTYASISLQWQPQFDGGWPQTFLVSLNNGLIKETNQSSYTFTSKDCCCCCFS